VTNFNANSSYTNQKDIAKGSIGVLRTPPNQSKMIIAKPIKTDKSGSKLNMLGSTVRF
jgi:hypothetical protein